METIDTLSAPLSHFLDRLPLASQDQVVSQGYIFGLALFEESTVTYELLSVELASPAERAHTYYGQPLVVCTKIVMKNLNVTRGWISDECDNLQQHL